MGTFILVMDKHKTPTENLYVNVDAVDCLAEDGLDTLLTLRSGRVVRAAQAIGSLRQFFPPPART
jgi:hypothetical protein